MDELAGTDAWHRALRTPDALVGGPAGPSLSARLEGWLADARVDGSADGRARERWLQMAAEADATFSGVLADLAERRSTVALTTTAGRRHHGAIEVLGADFVSLRVAAGAEVLVALRAVASVRSIGPADAAVGEQAVVTTLTLGEVLSELAAERTRALLVTGDGHDAVAGELRAAGQDVVTVRTDAQPPGTAYVRLASVAEVALG